MSARKRNVIVGLQPPQIFIDGYPASRRNTSLPFAALVLAESLRKEAERRADSEIVLVLLRGPRDERNEKGFETLAVNVSEGKILLHENIPAKTEGFNFFVGTLPVERMTVDLQKVAGIFGDLGADSVAVSAPWTSGLADVLELRRFVRGRRFVVGGSGLFPGFSRMLSNYGDTFVVIGPGFGKSGLDGRLYDLLTCREPSPPVTLFSSGNGAVVQLVRRGECRNPLNLLKRLARDGKAHQNYLGMEKAFGASADSLFPYLGRNLAGTAFLDMLSRFEFTEGDRSLMLDSPVIYLYLSYGCPRTCEYCTSPAMRFGQTEMSEEGVDETLRNICRILDKIKKVRVTIWDENPRPSDILVFLDKISCIATVSISDRQRRSIQIEFTNGFYPLLWEKHLEELRKGTDAFRERMEASGIETTFGAYFPAENWGYGDVKFYENKSDTHQVLNSRTLGTLLSLFDYIGTTAGMDSKLIEKETSDRYLAHLKEGWRMEIDPPSLL